MTDLKNLLEDLAGVSTPQLDEGDLLRRIRRRRRVRSGLVATSGVAAAAVVAVGAYAVLPGNTATPAGPATTTVTKPVTKPVTTLPPAPYHCGDAFPAPENPDNKRYVVTVTLTQKSIHRTATGWSGSLRSKYRYNGGLPYPLTGGLPPKRVALVHDGRMVGHATVTTTADVVELRAGQSNVVDVGIDIRSCAGTGSPSGSYLLYEDLEPTAKPAKGFTQRAPLGRLQLP